jgi:hypothetical protein
MPIALALLRHGCPLLARFVRQKHPIVTIASAQPLLARTRPTAAQTVRALSAAGIRVETTGRRCDRSFAYQAYIDALREGTALEALPSSP